MLDGRGFLLAILLPLAVQPAAAQTRLHAHPAHTASVVTVKASMQQFLHGFVRWLQQHPAATHLTQSSVSAGPPTHIGMAPLPSIDLYSPSGVSIYYASGSKENLEFIRGLPGTIQQAEREKKPELRPTLREAMEIIPELKPYEAEFLATKEYTVFAVTFTPPPPNCKAQDEAIRELKKRARRIGVHVIEVRLHKGQ